MPCNLEILGGVTYAGDPLVLAILRNLALGSIIRFVHPPLTIASERLNTGTGQKGGSVLGA